jgi:hypothetical protein
MKTIFKSMLLTALVMGMATAAMAQTGATTTITATARVLKPITLSAVDAAVGFGGVFAGTVPFLDPQGTNSANVGFTSNIGSVVVDATAGEPIRVEFPDTVHLLQGTTSRIAYQPIISAYDGSAGITANNRGTSLLLDDAASTATPPLVTGSAGTGTGPFGIFITSTGDKATLLIGGKIGNTAGASTATVLDILDSAQPTGTYSGTFTLNLLYAL